MKVIETMPIYITTHAPGWSWLGFTTGILFFIGDIFVIYASIAAWSWSSLFEKIMLIIFTCIGIKLSYWTANDYFKNAKEIETFSHNEYIIQANKDTTLGELNEYEILEYIDNYTFRVKENNNAK